MIHICDENSHDTYATEHRAEVLFGTPLSPDLPSEPTKYTEWRGDPPIIPTLCGIWKDRSSPVGMIVVE